MKRLIINCRDGISPTDVAIFAGRMAAAFIERRGDRDRVTVTFWLENNHPIGEIFGCVHGRNSYDSDSIWVFGRREGEA